jgi:CobQ-like glutamine amidotransferase family enzyme
VISPRLDLLVFYPDIMDVAADTANAAVLRVRAGWEGVDVRVDSVTFDEPLPRSRPDILLLGSGADEDLMIVSAHLARLGDGLRDWVGTGTTLLAVGSGLDLLTEGWERARGDVVPGAGVFSGTAPLLRERASGDLVVHSPSAPRCGEPLVGYENHSRGYLLGTGERALGTVRRGIGNGDAARGEGVEHGSAIGTHLHGPIAARNPGFADAVLARAMTSRHGTGFEAVSPRARRADELAGLARSAAR